MALRHQITSTEAVELLNEKSSSNTCHREYRLIENGKHVSGIRVSNSECRTTLSMSGGKIKFGYSTVKSELNMVDNKGEQLRLGPSKEKAVRDNANEDPESKHTDGDVWLQWGQRKRQRNGRVDFKAAVVQETFASSEKPTKTVKHPGMMKKHNRCLPTDAAPVNRLPISKPCITSAQQTSSINRSRNVDISANHFSTHSTGNDLRGSYEKAQTRAVSPLSEKPDTVAYHTRTASGNPFAVSAQGGDGVEVHQVKSPVIEKMNLQSTEWPKIVILLSRKEKEDDFFTIKRAKLPQRPKKRPKHIEKSLHFITPGMWLPDVTKERYEVREKKAVKKRPRGLKAMCIFDSDSE